MHAGRNPPVHLRVALGKHDHVKPLRDGRAASPRLSLDFIDCDPLPKAFREMVRGGNIDVSEMAVVTHLLAHRFKRPIRGLAIPLWSRLPHTNLVCAKESSIAGPADLDGSTIGVRAYAQTSGVWVRGILANDYNLDLQNITWGTMEDAHLPEYADPPNTIRYTAPPTLRDLLLRGEFAAIMGERVVDPAGVRSVIPDAERMAHEWINRTGIQPINHTLAVRGDLLDEHPWIAQELMSLFIQARTLAIADGAEPPPAYGLRANRASLQLCLRYSYEQKLTSHLHDLDEMYVL
jgi:4,5-dihydroxyphthalate decarboxylase